MKEIMSICNSVLLTLSTIVFVLLAGHKNAWLPILLYWGVNVIKNLTQVAQEAYEDKK